ncbi:3-dehydroquinate synthase [bacterium]|nr:MAG: 3-dehydroquinate synthase [bacterium]
MITLTTQSTHSYPISTQALESEWVSTFLKEKSYKRVFLIIDENVKQFHGDYIQNAISAWGLNLIGLYVVASGEASKSVTEWTKITDALLEADVKRNDAVFVFGGGVTGDLGGFATSTALRGVALVQFPTTILAMVDSAIGGKTGINHPTGKNRIGAFYQPDAVICDAHFLSTLPEDEWYCGIGEMLKYACISTPELFQKIQQLLAANSKWEAQKWEPIIQKSAEIKAQIVAEDEKETGIRAFLNFGHTFAHALEHELGYGKISHGDAVFWGCLAASELSRLVGSPIGTELEAFIPFYAPRFTFNPNTEHLIAAMKTDKKNTSDAITFVLLKTYGEAYLRKLSDKILVEKAWNYALSKTGKTA